MLKLLRQFTILVVCVVFANCASVLQDDLVVQTKNGRVRGIAMESVAHHLPFYAFRGIPFAEPPVENLRFEPPQPKKPWSDVLDATKDRERCIQGNPASGSEDCLFINVYTPKNPTATCEPHPVMVWIYGGGFEGGDSTYDLYGPDYLLEKDVVVVTFNYRLGFLGFMSTGDDVVPGNNGLKDQVLALKWVKDNIEKFCGDPSKVTLAGQSAGSASVAYHVQSPLSQGLFHKAIMQSGTSLSLWGLARRVPEMVKIAAEALELDTSSSKIIVDGLKSITNISYLQEKASSAIGGAFIASNPRDGFALGPVIEHEHSGAFFTAKSHQNLQEGNFAKVPMLIGFNSLEGTYNFEALFRLYLVQYDLHPEKLLPIDLNVDPKRESEAAKKLKSYYFGWTPVSLSSMKLMRFLSDDQFVRSIREFAKLVHKHVPDVFFYRFSYEGGLWGNHNRTQEGVSHSEELGYYWRSKHDPSSDHDLTIRTRMVTMWTNFIKFGNPTPIRDPVLQDAFWQPLGDKLTYFDIGHHLVSTQYPEKANMEFWDSLYAEYGQPPYDTY